MKRIEKQFISGTGECTDSSVVICFKGRGNTKVTRLHTYTSCRGYVTDRIRQHLQGRVGLGEPMTCGFASHMYLVESAKPSPQRSSKLTKKSFSMTKELCKRMGYKEPEHYEGRVCNIFKIDMRLFKNVYAGSMLFLLYRYSLKVSEAKDLDDFIRTKTAGRLDLQKRVIKLIDNWEEIFPVKEHTWRWMQGSDHKGMHHYEGISELLRGRAKFDGVRERANKILGGVKEVKVTHDSYSNPTYKVTGAVSDMLLQFS